MLPNSIILPGCVESRDDGKVVVRGHRVSLFLILDAHYSGLRIANIHERYPTISVETLQEIVDFCRDNAAAMEQFYKSEKAALDSAAATVATPDLEELRRRMP